VPFRLENITVLFVSLVKAGANKRTVIYKSATDGEGQPAFTREFTVRKADDAKQVVYGIVYPVGDEGDPQSWDTDGEFATAKNVEEASWRFMKQARTAAGVDRDHSYQALGDVYVVENWIVRKGDPLFADEGDVGAWAQGIKIEDAALYNELKAAGYTGFSMAGVAERVEITKSEKPADDGLLDKVRKLFGKEAKVDELKKTLAEITARLEKLEKSPPDPPASEAAGDADLTKQLADLAGVVKALESKIAKGEAGETVKTLKDELAKLKGGEAEGAIASLENKIAKLEAGETDGNAADPAAVLKAVSDLAARVETVEKAKPGSQQTEPTPGDKAKTEKKTIGLL